MRKKVSLLVALMLLAVCLAAGCGQKDGAGAWEAVENSVYVTRTMEVESAMVYTSAKGNELYSPEEMAAFAKEQIEAFNRAQGRAGSVNKEGEEKLPVALKESTLEGQTGKLVFEYATPEDFVRFAKETGDDSHSIVSLSVSSVSEAGDALSEYSMTTADGKAVSAEQAAKHGKYVALVFEGAGTVCTEGKIAYVSDGASPVTVKSSREAVTGEGKHCIIFK